MTGLKRMVNKPPLRTSTIVGDRGAMTMRIPRPRGQLPLSFGLVTTVDVEWGSQDALRRCMELVDLDTDPGTLQSLLERVFGPGATQQPNLLGAKEFGHGDQLQQVGTFRLPGEYTDRRELQYAFM